MGKRRKWDDPDYPGVIEDLEDQAAWSSYGSHIPRPGNPYRQAIWSKRFYRSVKRMRIWKRLLVIFGVTAVVVVMGFLMSLLLD